MCEDQNLDHYWPVIITIIKACLLMCILLFTLTLVATISNLSVFVIRIFSDSPRTDGGGDSRQYTRQDREIGMLPCCLSSQQQLGPDYYSSLQRSKGPTKVGLVCDPRERYIHEYVSLRVIHMATMCKFPA